MKNLAIMEMKKINAQKIDAKFDKTPVGETKDEQVVTGMGFPTYKIYERVPGKKPDDH